MPTLLDADDFRTMDSLPVRMTTTAARQLFMLNRVSSKKPAPFRLLPTTWIEVNRGDELVRAYTDGVFQVVVSHDRHHEREEYLTFFISRRDGHEVSYEALKKIRQAFLGKGKVALVKDPMIQASVRVMLSTMTGDRLPAFTVTMDGLPA